MSRGIYLNNPACIRLSGLNHWKGLSSVQKDKEFCTFDSVLYSIRALIIILRTYTFKHNLNSVRKIICRYAPSSENDTSSYISIVTNSLGNPHDLKLFYSWKSPTMQCFLLCRSICRVESGYDLTYDVFKMSVKLL